MRPLISDDEKPKVRPEFLVQVVGRQVVDIYSEPCEVCGDPMGSRGFHVPGCQRGVETIAARDVKAESLIRSLVREPDKWPGPYVSWRNRAASERESGLASLASYYERIRDQVAAIKGADAVKAEEEADVRCRRCEEIAMEVEAASGGETAAPSIAGVSGRHGIAHAFAEWLESVRLQPGRESVVDRDATKRYYRICFLMPGREFGGEVNLYGEGWVRVSWSGHGEWMPTKGSRIFESDLLAQVFIDAAFIDRDWRMAQMVLVKEEGKKARARG